MKMFEINLRCVEDVQDFVALACTQEFELTVGTERHRVNGKSFMQLFSLDLRQCQQVMMDCSQEDFDRFYASAARFRN